MVVPRRAAERTRPAAPAAPATMVPRVLNDLFWFGRYAERAEDLLRLVLTAQQQLVAEELCVPFDRVRLIQCDTSRTPDQGTTSGQQSHPANFNTANLALAAATGSDPGP